MITKLRNGIAITLSATIQQLGFIPDHKTGEGVKAIIGGEDGAAISSGLLLR